MAARKTWRPGGPRVGIEQSQRTSRSSRKRPPSKVIMLNCMHTVVFKDVPPRKGDTIYCIRCNHPSKVIVASIEHRFKCRTCGYSRSYGEAPVSARVFGSKHSVKCRHVVDIFYGNQLLETAGLHNASQLELSLDEPTF
jgi:hypothetical protein